MKHVTTTSVASFMLVLTLSVMLKAGGQPAELLPGLHSELVEVVPAPYAKALRNPLKGFTTRGIYDHEWATLAHTYIKWNEIENHEADGIDKICRVTNEKWGNSIRWLHCTQLRWIENYDKSNKEAQAGADLIQQAFGYRYIVEKVAFSPSITKGTLRVVLHVKNVGSAPFYYDWPLEVSLLKPVDRSVVWKQTFDEVNIRAWLPGEGWTAPEWVPTSGWRKYTPDPNWVNGTAGWTTPPKTYTASGDFKLTIPAGKYILALAVLDPAGQLPSLRFATSQYFKGGRHPVGIVAVNQGNGGPLPGDMVFDNPATDDSLQYIP